MAATDKPAGSARRTPIDWEAAHSRIAALQNILEGDPASHGRDVKRILKERTVKLARPPLAEQASGHTLQLIGFNLANEIYGVESRFVDEVQPLKDLTSMPCVPPFVLGIVNARGRIVSVVDLKRFFELPENDLTNLNRVIIVGNGKMEFGILADAVLGVLSSTETALRAAPTMFKGIRQDYLRGVASDGAIVLDVERLLADPRLVVHEEVED